MQSFRKGDVAASVKDFDEAMRLDPELRPYLWQRGLSLYYAGESQTCMCEQTGCTRRTSSLQVAGQVSQASLSLP